MLFNQYSRSFINLELQFEPDIIKKTLRLLYNFSYYDKANNSDKKSKIMTQTKQDHTLFICDLGLGKKNYDCY